MKYNIYRNGMLYEIADSLEAAQEALVLLRNCNPTDEWELWEICEFKGKK